MHSIAVAMRFTQLSRFSAFDFSGVEQNIQPLHNNDLADDGFQSDK